MIQIELGLTAILLTFFHHTLQVVKGIKRRIPKEKCAAKAIFCCPTENSHHLEA